MPPARNTIAMANNEDDDDDDGPSARHAFWADVLNVGDGDDSTLSVVGSGRTVHAIRIVPTERIEPWRNSHVWFGVSLDGVVKMTACCLALSLALLVAIKCLSFRHTHKTNKKKGREIVDKTEIVMLRSNRTEPSVVVVNTTPPKNCSNHYLVPKVITTDDCQHDLVDEDDSTASRPQHEQHSPTSQAMALYPASRVVPFSRQDSEADAEQVAGHVVAYKIAFAKAGMTVNDDTVCHIAIGRVSLHEKERMQEYREYRSHVIQSHHREQDFEHTERRHKEMLRTSDQDKDWLVKIYAARERSYTTLATSYFWLLICRVSASLLFQGRLVYRDGLYGVLQTLLLRFSDRCSPVATSVVDDSSWTAYLLSPLGGAYNYLSIASASVSKSSCYAMHGLICIILLIGALSVPVATKHLPPVVRTFVYGMCAIALSDTSLKFISLWAAVYGTYAVCIWYSFRHFIVSNETKTPTLQILNKFFMQQDDRANGSSILPPLAVIVYSCQMAAATLR
ncbi:hypothetical protein MPSEU_000505100 [Mayamaea pseudoterrestris]|nr:hypothetical protein MPSEU_000505100 [Mayamaea pseudoterrestris]